MRRPKSPAGSQQPEPQGQTGPSPFLNDGQRRHVAASLRHAAELLDRSEQILVASQTSPSDAVTTDLTPAETLAAIHEFASVRRRLSETAQDFGIDIGGGIVDARHAAFVQALFASNDLDEVRARNLRAYGDVDPATARRIDGVVDELETSLQRLRRALSRSGSLESSRKELS